MSELIPRPKNNMPEVIHDEEIHEYQRGGKCQSDQLSRDQTQVYGTTTTRGRESHRPGRGGTRPERDN